MEDEGGKGGASVVYGKTRVRKGMVGRRAQNHRENRVQTRSPVTLKRGVTRC